ncbi:MAG: late competence development ComFB family protein [Oscillospiraceae bacterium]
MARARKDFDKEELYRKLMPTQSLQSEGLAGEKTQTFAQNETSQSAAPENVARDVVVQKFNEEELSDDYIPNVEWVNTSFEQNSLSVAKSSQDNQGETQISPFMPSPIQKNLNEDNDVTNKLVVHNVMEDLVVNVINKNVQNFNCCMCEQCLNDMAALSLNLLPPKYIAATKDEIVKLTADYIKKSDIDISPTVIKSIIKVKSSPRHE